MRKIKLVFSGSGTNWPLFVGAYKAVKELGYEIEHVVGTSGGSIVAAMISSGYGPQELIALCEDISRNHSSLFDFTIFPLYHLGFLKGKKLNQEVKEYTFYNLLTETEIPCTIVAVDVDTGEEVLFGPFSEGVLVADAVSASIAIPLVFAPWTIEHEDGTLQRLVDGGVSRSMASDLFVKEDNVIAFRANAGGVHYSKRVTAPMQQAYSRPRYYMQKVLDRLNPFNEMKKYAERLFSTISKQINEGHMQRTPQDRLVVRLHGLENSFKINMQPHEMRWLIDQGYEETMNHLKK